MCEAVQNFLPPENTKRLGSKRVQHRNGDAEEPYTDQKETDQRCKELGYTVREDSLHHRTILHHRGSQIGQILLSEESQWEFT